MKTFLKILIGILIFGFIAFRVGMRMNRVKSDRAKQQGQQIAAQKQQRMDTNSNMVLGEWYGVKNLGGEDYLVTYQFKSGGSGERTVHFQDENPDGCQAAQRFEWTMSGGLTKYDSEYSMRVMYRGKPLFAKCKEAELAGLNQFADGFGPQERLSVKPRISSDFVVIEGLSKKEAAAQTASSTSQDKPETPATAGPKASPSDLKRLKQLEEELTSKIDGNPTGWTKKTMSISPEDLSLSISDYSKKHPLGTITLKKDGGYVFSTEFWSTGNFSASAGKWKGIRYLNQKGKEKTGDLELVVTFGDGPHYSVMEVASGGN